jgi:hypothetical protein
MNVKAAGVLQSKCLCRVMITIGTLENEDVKDTVIALGRLKVEVKQASSVQFLMVDSFMQVRNHGRFKLVQCTPCKSE